MPGSPAPKQQQKPPLRAAQSAPPAAAVGTTPPRDVLPATAQPSVELQRAPLRPSPLAGGVVPRAGCVVYAGPEAMAALGVRAGGEALVAGGAGLSAVVVWPGRVDGAAVWVSADTAARIGAQGETLHFVPLRKGQVPALGALHHVRLIVPGAAGVQLQPADAHFAAAQLSGRGPCSSGTGCRAAN